MALVSVEFETLVSEPDAQYGCRVFETREIIELFNLSNYSFITTCS